MKPVEAAIAELAASIAASAADAQATRSATGAAGEGTVLLVDDDPIVRMMTAAALAQRGWRVIEADSATSALQLFEREQPQVIALDAVMPERDGFATCELLRQLPGGVHVPVVMLTSLEDEQSVVRAYDVGASDFFVKAPGRWMLLSQRLRYLVRASRVRAELARSRADLLRVQRTDSLTGLPNRRRFQEIFGAELQRAHERGSRTGLLLLGVNRFRLINDSLGVGAGDQLLLQISRRLADALRGEGDADRSRQWGCDSDDVDPATRPPGPCMARVGGHEFAYMVPDLVYEDDLERLARQAFEAFEQPFWVGGNELFATASIGAVVSPSDGRRVVPLLARADLAMRTVEEVGGNGFRRYAERMNTTRAAHWKLESDLHRAIGLRQLRLLYQPKIDVATGAIVGAEALIRWQRDGELVSPAAFIPAAEDSGLIVPITEWVLTEACRQLGAWNRAGLPPIPLSVNISGRHLQRGTLTVPVRDCLNAYPIAPGQLELEITETALMRNLDDVLPQLRALKALGVLLSIDDFGTGYSSLAYLKRLPIDILKIDRAFVGELETSRESTALVGAIVSMGHGLDLDVVAEGVETREQMRCLAQRGCRLMQGYLFSHPVTPDRFADMLAQGSRSLWRTDGEAANAATNGLPAVAPSGAKAGTEGTR